MAQPSPGSWRLQSDCAADTQGFIVSPFSHLPEAVALLLDATHALGAAWLRALLDPTQGGLVITRATGVETDDAGVPVGCAVIAFTSTGLQQLGLTDPTVLSSFADPFIEGMHTFNRRRRLSDDRLDLRPGKPLWGGNAFIATEPDLDPITCERTIHAALLLYHTSPNSLAAYAKPFRDCLARTGVAIAHELPLSLMPDAMNPQITREWFGFADGISQPSPYGDGIVDKTGAPYPKDAVHGVASGDVLIGHINAHDEPAPGPKLPAGLPGAEVLRPVKDNAAYRDLGLNGSYLVIRELSQDVETFWKSMATAAHQIGAPSADWVAERVVGRTKDGNVLAKIVPPATSDGPGNAFMFWEDDADGRYCPLGSHVRRANPRDGLAPTAGDRATMLKAANNHRILRRGRKYHAYAPPGGPELPGLLFMCLNTDLERQFEFVQQTWMMNPSFACLFTENDPLLGPECDFTIPADPIRLRPKIDTFVRLVGGEYFFLPSLSALSYLATLDAGPA